METNKTSIAGVHPAEKPIFLPKNAKNQSSTGNFSDIMTIVPDGISIFWRPNNYRRQINIQPLSDSGIQKMLNHYPTFISYGKRNKLIFIKKWQNITIMIGKSTITGIFSQNKIGKIKEIFLIQADCIESLNERIEAKKKEIQEKIDNAIEEVTKVLGIDMLGSLKWSRYEDFVKGDEYIDKIPREVIIHDTYFKKVYGKGIEFKSSGEGEEPTKFLKNYIKNRAIEQIAPEIASSINSLTNTFVDFTGLVLPVIEGLSENMRTHVAIMKDIAAGTKKLAAGIDKFNGIMSQSKLTKWI